jgi:ribA/ribD-fused uncharacterized protein
VAWKTPYKERRTDEFVFFLTGPGSQWFPTLFTQSLYPGGPEYVFCCREQFQMAGKAELFGDFETRDLILRAVPRDRRQDEWDGLTVEEMQATVPATMARVFARLAADPAGTLRTFNDYPRRQKELGRAVRGFIEETWVANREEVVYAGTVACAAQDPRFRAWLLEAGERRFVEGSSKDRIWGVGIDCHDDRILNPANWNGLNLLGKTNGRGRDWLVRNGAFLDPLPGEAA